MTDLSGIRVIVYFESDIESVSKIIEHAFNVDVNNSLNQDDLMSADQIGYRSVHFVCDLGASREKLPEFAGLSGMKFEFQVRTVLQHAWAELAHDRNYKFAGKLPKKVERQLYLYAGMLEIADKGFDEVSRQIDAYIESVDKKSNSGELDVEIDSISLPRFLRSWSEKNGVEVECTAIFVDELILELNQFGVFTLEDLSKIIPENYVEVFKGVGHSSNTLGVVRDWMLIHDWRRFHENVHYRWVVDRDDPMLSHFFTGNEFKDFMCAFGDEDDEGGILSK